MKTFYLLLIISFLIALLVRLIGKNQLGIRVFFVLILTFLFIMVAGLRTGIGDTYFYKHSYSLLVQNPILPREGKDMAFIIFQLVLITLSTNPQFLVLITSLITNLCNIIGIYKYCNYFELQIYMFITSGYFLTTMNGMRQAMVAAILFLATPLIIKNKKWLYFLLVIILFNIHQSSLIMIPIYFIVREKPWSKKIWIMIGLLGVSFILYDIFESFIFTLLINSNYSHYSSFNEGGSSFIRAFIALIPVLGAYLFKDSLEKEWPESHIFINMTLINLIILCFSMYNWIFARLSYYFLPYSFILLPYLIMKWPNKKEKRMLYYGFLVCYFIFMYYEQVIQGLGLGYKMIEGSIF